MKHVKRFERSNGLYKTIPLHSILSQVRKLLERVLDARIRRTARVVVGERTSDEFEVKIGLSQSRVLSPLLLTAVVDLISRKTVMKDATRKLLYADDLALVANVANRSHS